MKIHEYQAKSLFNKFKIETLDSKICNNLDEIIFAANELSYPCVIKAQIHAGGRGKGGGIKIVNTPTQAKEFGKKILNSYVVTPQTDSTGQLVSSVLVEECCPIDREIYLAFVLDRESEKVCLITSSQGGMDIEQVADETPNLIYKEWINPIVGLRPYQIQKIYRKLNIPKQLIASFKLFVQNLYTLHISTDSSLTEINPLVITKNDVIYPLDAKINIDDNSLYRQSLINSMYDPLQDDEKEVEAKKHDLSYIALDGNIGCLVNGAGLAMATMDIIKHVGGSPANFLDIGGSATQEKVTQAIEIILNDKKVKAIFINVFGGIAKCDVIANGVVAAVRKLNLTIPLIVRLDGTNVEIGREILKKSNLKIITATNMLDGAQKSVNAMEL